MVSVTQCASNTAAESGMDKDLPLFQVDGSQSEEA